MVPPFRMFMPTLALALARKTELSPSLIRLVLEESEEDVPDLRVEEVRCGSSVSLCESSSLYATRPVRHTCHNRCSGTISML